MITVKLSDATVKVDGDFNATLAFVKSLPGRRYDGATKTNTVALSLAQFKSYARPFEIVDGAQAGAAVGKFGGTITSQDREWYATAQAAKRRITAEFKPRHAALRAELDRRAAAMGGLDSRLVKMIVAFDLDDQIEAGRIQFSSAARKRALLEISEWYATSAQALMREEEDVKSLAESYAAGSAGIF